MDRLACGVILTSHGIKGECKVKSLSGEVGHFGRMRDVYLLKDNRETKQIVEKVRFVHNSILLKLKGIDTPEAAKTLSGSEIWVDRAYANPLSKGEFYYADLVTCVVRRRGTLIGTVKSIVETGAAPLLEIVSETNATMFCPLNRQFIADIDIGSRTIEMTEEADFT